MATKKETKPVIGIPSEEMLSLEAYILQKKDGEYITYPECIDVLKIDLRVAASRAKFYTACKRLGRECLNKPGYGYQLSSKSNVLPIVYGKTTRVTAAARRMVTAASHVKNMHKQELTAPVIDVLNNAEYSGSAICGSSRSMTKIIRKEHLQITEAKPHV